MKGWGRSEDIHWPGSCGAQREQLGNFGALRAVQVGLGTEGLLSILDI